MDELSTWLTFATYGRPFTVVAGSIAGACVEIHHENGKNSIMVKLSGEELASPTSELAKIIEPALDLLDNEAFPDRRKRIMEACRALALAESKPA